MILKGRFLQLIRWPNILFIAITQILFYYSVFEYAYKSTGRNIQELQLKPEPFLFILIASVFIASAGYIINDYFDINIDQVNKSEKVLVGKYVDRRTAILLHALFSLTGLLFSALASYMLRNIYILFPNFFTVLLLLFYSTTFKRKLLIGNVIISMLTAWTILILPLAEYRFSTTINHTWQIILKFSIIYGGFAFIISLIREAIKDMEDMNGDMKYGCTTMPVVWGLQVSKAYCGVWIIVLAGMVTALAVYIIPLGWWPASLYGFILIVLPLLQVLRKLYIAALPGDFHKLSRIVKLIMLAGILSISFFFVLSWNN